MNTNYLLRQPSREEIRGAFGSLSKAVEVTAGDIPSLCFLIANPERIPDVATPPHCSGAFADGLKTHALQELVVDAFKRQLEPTLAETARATGLSRYTVRKTLAGLGLWPVAP